jgi:hypothetical protein
MGAYKAKLTVPGVFDWPLPVEIDLTQGRLAISTGTGEIGAWNIDDIEVLGRDEGFELRAEGDVIRFTTVDDGHFAREIDLHWAPPRLRRLIAVDLSETSMPPQAAPVRTFPPTAGLREQFSASIDGAGATSDGDQEQDAGTAPRNRRGRHQRHGKGRHRRPVDG